MKDRDKLLERLVKDGFGVARGSSDLESLALLSLRIALKAYFSTARAMRWNLHIFYGDDAELKESADFNHRPSYWEKYAETVLHFQHFAELICKDLLRKEHEGLVTIASGQPTILYDLLKGNEVPPEQLATARTIGFSEALKKLCDLVKNGRMISDESHFIRDSKEVLEKLNGLRDRIWHRGTYILRYPALDEFVGRFILPFVIQAVSWHGYSEQTNVWKYKPLSCGIDPIEAIRNDLESNRYDIQKTAFLKELGRAAYSNPLSDTPFLGYWNRETRRQAMRFAEAEVSRNLDAYRMACPVCGTESLLVCKESDFDDNSGRSYTYVSEVRCMCCSYEPHPEFGQPSDHGFAIENWE